MEQLQKAVQACLEAEKSYRDALSRLNARVDAVNTLVKDVCKKLHLNFEFKANGGVEYKCGTDGICATRDFRSATELNEVEECIVTYLSHTTEKFINKTAEL